MKILEHDLPPDRFQSGGAMRQTYTLYGDTANLAQRLERLNKEFGTDCLVSGTTFSAARLACCDAVAVGPVQVRRRDGDVEVFALRAPYPRADRRHLGRVIPVLASSPGLHAWLPP